MKLCFLVEENYLHDSLPVEVVRQLDAWGHHVDVLRPGGSLLRMTDLVAAGSHDAWVLKTVSGGPGLTVLEAAACAGLVTVNDARAIRGVRDKALAAAIGRRHGLPMPSTYAAARPEHFAEIPESEYPLVVKPANGSSGRSVHLVATPERLTALVPELRGEGLLIAQPYVPNPGIDIKVYCVGGDIYATEHRSPLHPDHPHRGRLVPLSREVAAVAARVGAVYGLDLYGLDVLLTPDGPVVVDVNDFPSFRQVPDAVARVAGAVLDLARSGRPSPAPGAPAITPATTPAAAPTATTASAPGPAVVPVP
ncbi:RimK family alpha-L-glutamate ligase [Streptomyces sp. HPF1205]|uniref:ATP-grasp domain-containing protein n=1 Tax=Streptomyces sp. HPF1205 TaxID=2873262 RepID=UPI001CEC067F|nr:ATP-grasp domain-containing protein [Streptomyces sp. HPF1205]